VVFLVLYTLLNFARATGFKMALSMAVYAEMARSVALAVLLFRFFRQHKFSELFRHLGTGTAPSETVAFLAALTIADWAFIGFDACSSTTGKTIEPKRVVPQAIFFSLSMVGSVVMLNSAALTLSFDRTTLASTSA
jgi:amino acid transporter